MHGRGASLFAGSVLDRASRVAGHVLLDWPRRGIHGGCPGCAWPWTAGWFEAVGTWFGGLVAAAAVVSAVVAFKSEDFARRLEQARANRDERAKLQQEADLVMCSAQWAGIQAEPGIQLAERIEIKVTNRSSYMVTNVTCLIPQIGDEPIKLAEMLPPGKHDGRRLQQDPPLRMSYHIRELYDGAEFRFSLGGVSWSGQYAQPAERRP